VAPARRPTWRVERADSARTPHRPPELAIRTPHDLGSVQSVSRATNAATAKPAPAAFEMRERRYVSRSLSLERTGDGASGQRRWVSQPGLRNCGTLRTAWLVLVLLVLQLAQIRGQVDCLAGQQLVSGACTDCPAGQYKEDAGNSPCIACAAGHFTTRETGSTECVQCPLGRYSADGDVAAGADVCDECAAGEFATRKSPAPSWRLPCNFSTGRGSGGTPSDRQLVLASSEGDPADAAACAQLVLKLELGANGASYRSPNNGNRYCYAEFGMTNRNIDSNDDMWQSCVFTDAGDNNNYGELGATQCFTCPVGRYSVVSNSTCVMCGVGTYGDVPGLPGLSSCIECPNGRLTEEPGSTSANDCSACPPGEEPQRQTCNLCVPGKYSNVTGPDECTLCPGHQATRAGATSEDDCTSCGAVTRCPLGQHRNQSQTSGLAMCICDADHYSTRYRRNASTGITEPMRPNQPGAEDDRQVPDIELLVRCHTANRFYPSGMTPNGKLEAPSGYQNADCLPCGECMDCFGLDNPPTGGVPTIDASFIRYFPLHSSNSTIAVAEVYPCDTAGLPGSERTCLGKLEVIPNEPASRCNHTPHIAERTGSDDTWCCDKASSAGHLCMSCKEDYFWQDLESGCEMCSTGGKIARYAVPIASILLILALNHPVINERVHKVTDVVRAIFSDTKSRMQSAAYESDASVQRVVKARAIFRSIWQPVRIVISYSQIVSQLGVVLDVRMPEPFHTLMQDISGMLAVGNLLDATCAGLGAFVSRHYTINLPVLVIEVFSDRLLACEYRCIGGQ
jgi:hypothetical protein